MKMKTVTHQTGLDREIRMIQGLRKSPRAARRRASRGRNREGKSGSSSRSCSSSTKPSSSPGQHEARHDDRDGQQQVLRDQERREKGIRCAHLKQTNQNSYIACSFQIPTTLTLEAKIQKF
ncbi:hypothetical protein CEXT_63331 [Caerostris extrusa]|uniref:Uncharacterized protein n=1 Tax=Caerostris extrusa TaxID=172846 RepID=A0AAV4WEU0_CAEEX|nr:hypothetical protein CEXT_63331 [Caerostris extrusa]